MEEINKKKSFMVVGNWKMNGSRKLVDEFANYFASSPITTCRRVLCVPSLFLPLSATAFEQSGLELGGQNCHGKINGAYTGEVSAVMLKDVGAKWVILGHSERREGHGETSAIVKEKALAAIDAGLCPIICVGESADDRKSSRHIDVILQQLEDSVPNFSQSQEVVFAYEPVWAIGSGLSASTKQVSEAHRAIANWLVKENKTASILYGGSVKPETAGELAQISNLHGFLVGGASLDPRSFSEIEANSSKAIT